MACSKTRTYAIRIPTSHAIIPFYHEQPKEINLRYTFEQGRAEQHFGDGAHMATCLYFAVL